MLRSGIPMMRTTPFRFRVGVDGRFIGARSSGCQHRPRAFCELAIQLRPGEATADAARLTPDTVAYEAGAKGRRLSFEKRRVPIDSADPSGHGPSMLDRRADCKPSSSTPRMR
jgi:hypothetical protein